MRAPTGVESTAPNNPPIGTVPETRDKLSVLLCYGRPSRACATNHRSSS
jgi:hypothetical protein